MFSGIMSEVFDTALLYTYLDVLKIDKPLLENAYHHPLNVRSV